MSYSDKQLDIMRGQLAKTWRQDKSQVTDTEARFYLDIENELLRLLTAREPQSHEGDGD